ncbi:DUF4276 family protein [Wenyingzhuangia sp. chi5]|uniref:DUF4276 family protein n=1 Tax=Wenyingzhuangia gilva TaxID=3057677 RepID=A0ABT8VVC5_9FLAO|nr:DUF4276 family protein [Wenyingzhuangia sp. chi5]MDO3695928.1 DUF4276 family protein [Wenyingzhuangia sp. chi5]
MSKKKIKCIGLIVEDNSDFDSFKKIISRITNKSNLSFKKAIGNGCGKIKRKASSYANILHQRGCDMIILVHDLDRNNLAVLKSELNTSIKNSPAKYNYVCVPVEEIEGWFLSDPMGIKNSLKLYLKPKISSLPENIASPKEKIGELVYQCSNKTKIYLNTKHNSILADSISIEEMKKKCNSFNEFYDFINQYDY